MPNLSYLIHLWVCFIFVVRFHVCLYFHPANNEVIYTHRKRTMYRNKENNSNNTLALHDILTQTVFYPTYHHQNFTPYPMRLVCQDLFL